MLHKSLMDVNEGGVQNWVYYDDEDSSLHCMDVQPGYVNQEILEENKRWRERDDERYQSEWAPATENLRKVASIPITMWTNWRREWDRQHRDTFTWDTFLLMRLHRPEYAELLTTNRPFPDRYSRDRVVI